MTRFSASDAALEGFQILGVHWRVAVGWGVFNLLAIIAMVVITVIIAVGISLAAGVQAGSGAAITIGALVSLVVTFLIEMSLIVGVYRLMLRPTDPGFLHLRLGRDEGRLFLVALAIGCGAFVLAGLAVAASQFTDDLPFAARIAAWAVALAVGGWLALRLGLTAPISFAERKIDFARSWRMTRGQTWPLLGMWFLNFCLVMLVWLVLWLVVFALSGLLTGFHGFASAEGGEALEGHPLRYLIEGVVPVLALPALLVLTQAPWVAVYKALTADPADA